MINPIEKIVERLEARSLPLIPRERLEGYTLHYAKVLKKYGYNLVGGTHKIPEYIAYRYAAQTFPEFRPEARGLFLAGNPGTGKTYAMEFIAGHFNIPFQTATEIDRVYAAEGDLGFWNWFFSEYKHRELIIDDLGAERNAKHFGNEGIITEVIMKRYELWKEAGYRTYYTTNLTPDEIRNRYGERIYSRFAECCVYINITGQDYRKAAPEQLTA